MGKPLCTTLTWAWLVACFFIHLYGSLCVEGLCVTWLDLVIACGVWIEKYVRIVIIQQFHCPVSLPTSSSFVGRISAQGKIVPVNAMKAQGGVEV